MRIFLLLVAVATLGLSGCVPLSIDPIVARGEELKVDWLEGIWLAEDGTEWRFEQQGIQPVTYRALYIHPQGRLSEFSVLATELAGRTLLDLVPLGEPSSSSSSQGLGSGFAQPDLRYVSMRPMHLWIAAEFQGDWPDSDTSPEPRLNLSLANQDYLSRRLKADPKAAPHAWLSGKGIDERPDWPLLTGTTAQLRDWLGAVLVPEEAWEEAVEFRRVGKLYRPLQSNEGYDSQYRSPRLIPAK